jgi:HAMP domain-containing protein
MKRSHTEATDPLAIYGQCFRIKKSSSESRSFCELQKRKVCLVNSFIGEIVQVDRCKFGEDRCYNKLNLVNVAFLHRNVFCHVPVDCVDVNNPLKYQCFLCDNANLTSHFDNARMHLIECHPSECWPAWITPENKSKPKLSYITPLKRLLLDQYSSRDENSKKYDLYKLRKKTGIENKRFKAQQSHSMRFNVQLKKSNNVSTEKKAEIEALKSELQQEKIINADLEKIVDKLNVQLEKAITDPEEKKTEIEQLKATIGHLTNELKNAKATIDIEVEDKESNRSVTMILNADLEKKVDKLRAQLEKAFTDPEDKKTEIEQLKATIGRLTNELKYAKATINIEFEDKECKCSVTKILNADLEKKVDKLEKTNTDIEMKKAEIEQLKATISHLTTELKNAKATINIEFEDKECKCSVTKILNADLEKKVDKLKGHLELREKEIRALTELKMDGVE